MHKRPLSFPKLRKVPRSSAGSISAWSVSAISINSAPCLCPLSLSGHCGGCPGIELLRRALPVPALVHDPTDLRQARQALITLGLIAYRRPLYQVLALRGGESGRSPPTP